MVIDCILFYGGVSDLDLLKLRLAEHSKFVDLFVISQLAVDFQGQPKQTIDLSELTKRYNIRQSIIIQWSDESVTPFDKANAWRNEIKQYLKNYQFVYKDIQDTDTIIFTDLDEILNAKKWNYTPDMGLMAIETRLYYYYVNLSANAMWQNGFIAPYGFIKDKDITTLRYNYSRRKYDTGLLHDAGWHFAWLGGKEVIKDKYRNFGQAEGWNPALKSDDYIDHILKDRILFTTGQELELVAIDNSYPDELRFNAGKYLPFIYDIEK